MNFWSESCSKIQSFEIGLYENIKIPSVAGLYPPMPIRKFQFGPTAVPSLIQLCDYDVDLDNNSDGKSLFQFSPQNKYCLSEYDHYGIVRHTLTPLIMF